MSNFSFESMGTIWKITIWDQISTQKLNKIQKDIIHASAQFENSYSRFSKKSLVRKIEQKTGEIKVPREFTQMLFLYMKLFDLSNGMLNPLVGYALSDLGYDEKYSLKKKNTIRLTPDLLRAVTILDETHIKKNQIGLFDFGALGKGYFVDIVSLYLFKKGIKKFLVDGSGDIYYQGETTIKVGLEHPNDSAKVIGVLNLKDGSVCASSGNRRQWKNYHHIINPFSHKSPTDIIATWVTSSSAAIADGLATALFLSPPEAFLNDFQFEYLLLNKNYKVKKSEGFLAELF